MRSTHIQCAIGGLLKASNIIAVDSAKGRISLWLKRQSSLPDGGALDQPD
jgi:hypothetical protein